MPNELPEQDAKALIDLVDVAFNHWTLLNGGLRSAQLKKDLTSIVQFSNGAKTTHEIVRRGVKLLAQYGLKPSFEHEGDVDAPVTDDIPPDDLMGGTSKIILP